MKYIPIKNQAVVKQLEVEKVTKSGIIIPETVNQEKPLIGTLISIGEDVGEPYKRMIGKKVIFQRYRGQEISVGGENLLSIDFNEIHGFFDEE